MEDEFNLTKVKGISKNEWYISSYNYPTPGSISNNKIIRYLDQNYLTLYDTYDLNSSVLPLYSSTIVTRLDAIRCSTTDSLYLFVSGIEHVKLTSFSSDLIFRPLSLSRLGRNENEITSTSPNIFALSPNNVWIPTTKYGIYHYNGFDMQKIESIPNLPYGNNLHSGLITQMVLSESGRLWILMMSETQQYVLIQGTPL